MTNFMNNLKSWELRVWNNGTTWHRARIAHKYDAMENLTTDELNELVETVKEMNFQANMSDDWSVTLKEINENTAIANKARELLAA